MDVSGMNNARLGVVYLWQGVNVKSPIADAVMGGVMTSVSGILGTKDINVAEFGLGVEVATMVAESRSQGQTGLFNQIKAWAEDLMSKIWGKIKEIFGDVAEMLGTLKGIALFVTQQVFAKAAPIIGGAVGLVQGLWKTTVGIIEKVGSWIASKGVKIAFGHPQTLVNGVEQGLTRSLLEGIYETIKSAVSLGLNVASFGGAAIVDCVVGIVEAAIKIIWRVAESKVVNKFILEASNMWNTKDTDRAMHTDNQKFDDWLRPVTQKVPLVASVTLGSGIAGDKMRFLQMYTGVGQIITKSSFNKSVTYLDQLKRAGSRLMERSGVEFTSDNETIAGLLKLANSHDEVHAKKSRWKRFFRVVDKVVRA
ncbi:MAG: hypothetical protein COB83_09955 [Gammaproteobacteria bacterium]|nr:MAG: hypothetical protein COB83_09955 [Gammaproteobacteria bacterium]